MGHEPIADTKRDGAAGVQIEPAAVAQLDNVTAAYGARRVIQGVSLTLLPSEIYVLLGPNGSGKSTVVRLLTGTLPPGSGRVELVSHRTGGISRARRPVSLVPQDIALYSWLTARENALAFAGMAGLGRREARARADWALALTGCKNIADQRVERLSGGYKRRVNIAAALVGQPSLLILDEPTAGVDLAAKRSIGQTLKTLRGIGISILLITHDFEEAEPLADRAGFLSHGRLVGEGAPRALAAGVFGARKRIEIVLNVPPDEFQTQVLCAAGATRGANEAVWIMFKAIGQWDAGSILPPLEACGLAVHELRMRDPGLEALYTHFCQVAPGEPGTGASGLA